MLTPREFKNKYSKKQIEDQFEDEPITSLREIQYLYGKLYVLATADAGEYAKYYTPDAANDIIGDENSLITINVDLTGSTPTINTENSVVFDTLTKDDLTKVGFSYYRKKGSGREHSISRKTSARKTKGDIIGYAEGRFEWPKDEILDVAEEHDGGWIIEDLLKLQDNTDELNKIRQDIWQNWGEKENPEEEEESPRTQAIVTVAIKTEKGSSYKYPGEIDVLNQAMERKLKQTLVSKNDAKNSTGEGTDMVTGEETRLVGTANDPLNFFSPKQKLGFKNFNQEQAWRSHQVGEDTAILINKSETFLEACSYVTKDDLETFGASTYYLPYVTQPITAKKIYDLYTLLYRVKNEEWEGKTLSPMIQALKGEQEINANDIRFYVAVVNKKENTRYDVLGSRMNCRTQFVQLLEQSHKNVLSSWLFEDNVIKGTEKQVTISAPFRKQEGWTLLSERNLLENIVNGLYLSEAIGVEAGKNKEQDKEDSVGRAKSDSTDDEGIPNDSRKGMQISLLAGEPIDEERLIKEYVDQIISKEEPNQFPSLKINSQYAQLTALANANLLKNPEKFKTAEETPPNISNNTTMTEETNQDSEQDEQNPEEINKAQRREDKLKEFIETTPWAKDDERLTPFLIGVLVGQVSNYQQGARQVSKTLIKDHPINSINPARLEKISHRAMDRAFVYSDIQNLNSTMYNEVLSRITELASQNPPRQTSLSNSELRFYYGIGVSYGYNNYISEEELEQEDPPEDLKEAEA